MALSTVHSHPLNVINSAYCNYSQAVNATLCSPEFTVIWIFVLHFSIIYFSALIFIWGNIFDPYCLTNGQEVRFLSPPKKRTILNVKHMLELHKESLRKSWQKQVKFRENFELLEFLCNFRKALINISAAWKHWNPIVGCWLKMWQGLCCDLWWATSMGIMIKQHCSGNNLTSSKKWPNINRV